MPPLVKISEAKIEKKVVTFCRKHGLYTRKFASPSNRGVPDRIIGRLGKVLFLELKSLGNKPTPLQFKEHQEMHKYGLNVAWVDNYEDAALLISDTFNLSGPPKPVIEKPRTVVQPVEVAVHGPASDMI